MPAAEDDTWRVCVAADAATDVSGVVVTNSDATAGLRIVARDSTGNMDEETSNWTFVNIRPGTVVTWTGASENGAGWTDADNWDVGREPVETDNIVIAATDKAPLVTKDIVAWSLTVESGATLSLAGFGASVSNLTVRGALAAAGSGTITVTKDASFAGGAFDCGRATLLFTGTADQAFAPAGQTFHDVRVAKDGGTLSVTDGFSAERFYVAPRGAVTATFAAGVLVSVRQAAFDGLLGGVASLTLASATGGVAWRIQAKAFARAAGVIVSDSDATGGCAFRTQAPSTVTRCENWSVLASAFTWTGAADNNFTNAANWAGGVAPGAEDDATVAGPATLALATPWTVRDLTLGGGEDAVTFTGSAALAVAGTFEIATNATVTLNAASSVAGSLIVRGGGKLTHAANGATPVRRLDVTVGGDVLVEAGGRIDAVGRGYAKDCGPGTGMGWCGASHGGEAEGKDPYVAATYGSVLWPRTLGSGGEGNVNYGTPGGGAIEISAGGEIVVDGTVTANGADDLVPKSVEWGYYTGAGGSILLRAAALTGVGLVEADGGDVGTGYPGGGGRIAIRLTGSEAPAATLAVTAYGGRKISAPAVYYPSAGAGTIYVQGASQAEGAGTVYVRNDGGSNTRGTMVPSDDAGRRPLSHATFALSSGGCVKLTGDCWLGDVDLGSGGALRLQGHALTLRYLAHKGRKGWKGTVVADGGRIDWYAPLRLLLR